MRKYALKRFLHLIPILFGITFLNFALMHLAPGDAAMRILAADGMGVERDVLEASRAQLGIDKPFLVQYANWMVRLSRGDLGRSFATGREVWSMLAERLPFTALLAASAMLLTIAFSIPLGLLAATKKDGWVDYLLRLLSFGGVSMPGFVLALGLIYIFGLRLGWLPVIGAGPSGLILPSLTLAAALTCAYLRQVRASVLEEMDRDYVLGARARGVRERSILFKGVLRNALIPIVTLMGLSFGGLLGGTAVVETIFMWPGLGSLVVEAIRVRDYPVVQGYVIWTAAIFVAVNLITDLSYRILSPGVTLSDEVA
jgi:peptide/nickel transport system permease protein